MGDTKIQVFRRGEGTANTTQTVGMEREELIATPEAWVGMVQTQPHFTSGWHHHGEYDTYVYVISGQIRLEFGTGGKESCVAQSGEVVFIPKHTIHRESNPAHEQHLLFGVRIGKGTPVFNVDGPEQGGPPS